MSSIIKVDTIQKADGNTATVQDLGLATGALSHRNLIINGAMQVAQRGTSFTASSSPIYTLDRFKAENDSAAMTVSQDTEAPTGFNYSLKCLNGTGSASSGGDANYIRYYTEGYDTAHLEIGTANAKAVTLSFWVRSSITGTYIVGFADSGNDNGYPASYTINTADTWEHKTITLTMSTYSSWVGDSTTGRSLGISWDLGSGPDRDLTTVNAWNDGTVNDWTHSSQTDWVATTGATFYLTGVQLEVGSVATPFEHRSYGEELARCQRYYEVIYSDGYGETIFSFDYNGSQNRIHWFYKVEKRTAPTFGLASGGSFDNSYTSIGSSVSRTQVYHSSPTFLKSSANTITAYVDAEL